jgi:hypothetical protein
MAHNNKTTTITPQEYRAMRDAIAANADERAIVKAVPQY